MAEQLDTRLEALLRGTLKEQAATLPVAIGPGDVLRRRELRRRESARGRMRLLLIAALVALPVGAILIGAPRPDPKPEGYSAVLVRGFDTAQLQVLAARDGVAERVRTVAQSLDDKVEIRSALEASEVGWLAMWAWSDDAPTLTHREFLVLLDLRDPQAMPVVRDGSNWGAWTPDGLYWSVKNGAYELIDPASGHVTSVASGVGYPLDYSATISGRVHVAAESHGLLMAHTWDAEFDPRGLLLNSNQWAVLSPDGTISAGLPDLAEGRGPRVVSSQAGTLGWDEGGVRARTPGGSYRAWGELPPLHHYLVDASWAVDGGIWLLIDRRSDGRTMLLIHRDEDDVDREVAAFPVSLDARVSLGDLAPDDSLIALMLDGQASGPQTVIIDTHSGSGHLYEGQLGGFVSAAAVDHWGTGARVIEAGQALASPAPGTKSGLGYGPLPSLEEQIEGLGGEPVLLVHEVDATSPDPGPPIQLTLGPVELEEGVGIWLVCSGPGKVTLTLVADGSSDSRDTFDCLSAAMSGRDWPSERWATAEVLVEFDPSTSWRLVVFDPPPHQPSRWRP